MRSLAAAVPVLVVFSVSMAENVRAADEPPLAITAIDPSEAPSGAHIKLAGRGFRGTKKVWFVVGNLKTKEAKHRVVSDTELDVEVPEYFSPNLQAAIIVETGAGVTVTMPRSGLRTVSRPSSTKGDRFMIIEAGGAAAEGGSYVTFIEKEAIVTSANRVTLIAKGGRLDNVAFSPDRSMNVVFAEPGAQISDQARRNGTIHQVAHVYYSPLDKLFTYELASGASPTTGELSQSGAPHITAIKPNEGVFGDIIEIHGKGFVGTQSVKFYRMGPPQKAAFRLKSDTVLRVEVPFLGVSTFDTVIVIVESPEGIAFTMPRGIQPITTPNARVRSSYSEPVAWIGKGGSVSSGGAGVLAFVDDGGIVTGLGGGSSLAFIKNGGTVLEAGSREVPFSIYAEPKAKLSDPVRRGRGLVEVPKINACFVDAYFNTTHNGVLPGPRR